MTFVYLLDQFMSVILLIILKFSEALINKILLVSDLRKIFVLKLYKVVLRDSQISQLWLRLQDRYFTMKAIVINL